MNIQRVIGRTQTTCKHSLLLLGLTGITLTAQADTIRGTILDKQTREPLTGATIQVVGGTQGAVADIDGHYLLDVKPGTYQLEIRYIGYKDLQLASVVVGSDPLELNIELESDAHSLGEVSVVARKNLEGERALQMERQQSTLAIENLGAKEMSIKGISNVQEGVKKLTGISIAKAGQLIVRGLGDRYSSTTLNGLPIASPNPDNKLIPLDLFPAATVQHITVSKVYYANAFADYSGAQVDISTKEDATEDYFNISFDTGGKFNTLGKDFYHSDRKGSLFSTGNLPERYWDLSRKDFQQVVKQEDIFGTSFAIDHQKSLPDLGGTIGGSKSWTLANGQRLHLLASAGLSHEQQIMEDAYSTTLTAQGTVKNHFGYDSYQSELKMAGLLNLGYSFRQADRINYTLFYARNAVDTYLSRQGTDAEGNALLGSNSTFHAYNLLNNQLNGHHELGNGRWELDWSGSYATTGSDEPDRRQVMFRRDENGDTPTSLFTLNQQETLRYFGELDEKEGVGSLRLTYRLGEKNFVQVGGAYKDKQRDFRSMYFFYDIDRVDPSLITNIYDTDAYLNFGNIANGTLTVDRKKYPNGTYSASHRVWAAYATADYVVTDRLLASFGLRYEQSKQVVDYFSQGGTPGRSTLDQGDLFPALNLKYDFNPEHSLRFAASRTVTRPAFVEMAPFNYQESYGSASLCGNADLKNGYNYNFDLRYDFFPRQSSDFFSVTAYFKVLEDPIERIQTYMGGDVTFSFQNADTGIATGLEIEARKELLPQLRLGANASFMYTNVSLTESEGAYTDSQRALQGASPYLANVDLSYSPQIGTDSRLSLALVYNLQGPRIHAVGYAGLNDVKQDPLHTLNFIGHYELNRHVSIKLQAKDLLNSTVRFKQKVADTGEKMTVESFQPGTAAEVGFSYRF